MSEGRAIQPFYLSIAYMASCLCFGMVKALWLRCMSPDLSLIESGILERLSIILSVYTLLHIDPEFFKPALEKGLRDGTKVFG